MRDREKECLENVKKKRMILYFHNNKINKYR
jgi:hypothetical protein